MGAEQGEALAAEVRRAREVMIAGPEMAALRPALVPASLFALVARRRSAKLLGPALARHAPDAQARLVAIARGAGLAAADGYLLHAAELLLGAADWRDVPPAGACSAAALRGARAQGGGPLLHHNFDYPPFTQPFYVVRESRPAKGLRHLAFTAAPLAGAIDGVNERGLAVAYNYAYARDAGGDPVPMTVVVGMALERCATAAEAAALVVATPRGGAGILTLADEAGDVVRVEASRTRAEVMRAGPSDDMLFHTNVYAAPALREVEIPRSAVYSRKNQPALRGRRVHASGEARLAHLERLLGATSGALDDAALQRLFADHGATGAGTDETVCRHGPAAETTAMVQLFPRERRLRVAFTSPCRAEPVEFAL
jgi:isopenicillin-N N-acyltransferase like protein